MFLAHLSDFHMSAGEKNHRSQAMRAAVAAVAALPVKPDAVVLSGDVSGDGSRESYQQVREVFSSLSCPVFPVMGNHDDPEHFFDAFAGDLPLMRGSADFRYVVQIGERRLVFVDTRAGPEGGALGADRLDWLDRILAADPDAPTVLVMHHPPFLSGIDKFDRHRLKGWEELAALIQKPSLVKGILCGHLHRWLMTSFAGVPALAAPPTFGMFPPDFRPEPGRGDSGEGGGMLLHLWREELLTTPYAMGPMAS